MRKIDLVLVRRRIGTVIEAEFAIIAFVDDPMMIGRRQLRRRLRRSRSMPIEQRVERWAEIEAAPAPVADLIDPERLFVELRGIDGIDQAESPFMLSSGSLKHEGWAEGPIQSTLRFPVDQRQLFSLSSPF